MRPVVQTSRCSGGRHCIEHGCYLSPSSRRQETLNSLQIIPIFTPTSKLPLTASSKMGKKKAFKPKPPPSCSRMYLSLHENVAAVLSEHCITARFHNNENGEGATRSFPTNIFGRFTCDNKGCSGGVWISGKIATLIRQYPNDGYNAVVYSQRCEKCEKLGRLQIDKDSYVDRVSYRIKMWKGVRMERPVYKEKTTKPHKSWLCEGCKRGVCKQLNK
jgi:hypothetical protein